MNFNEKAKEIHADNVAKGFYDDFLQLQALASKHGDPKLMKALDQTFDAQRIALIQSEASEALEANRKDKKVTTSAYAGYWSEFDDKVFIEEFENEIKDTEEDEIADTMIRLLDYAGFKGIDLDFHIEAKLKYNRTRPYKHGKSM